MLSNFAYIRFFTTSKLPNKELLVKCYHDMYEGMINKDTNLLCKVLDDSFVLTHITGAKQNKKEYIGAIIDGSAKYFKEITDKTVVTISGDNAEVIGQSCVTASVGNDKGEFRLQLDLKASKIDGEWRFTSGKASTY